MNNKKLAIYLSFLILSLIVTASGFTYAYLSLNVKQSATNVLETACFSTSFSESNKINLTSYPMSNAKGLALTPYRFTVVNNCNNNNDYQLYLNVLSDSSSVLLNYINYSIDGKTVKNFQV